MKAEVDAWDMFAAVALNKIIGDVSRFDAEWYAWAAKYSAGFANAMIEERRKFIRSQRRIEENRLKREVENTYGKKSENA